MIEIPDGAIDYMDAAQDQVCEALCGRELIPGEPMIGYVYLEHGTDPYGLNSISMGGIVSDHDMSSGKVAHGWVCEPCFKAGRRRVQGVLLTKQQINRMGAA